jgi:hypothetical protein
MDIFPDWFSSYCQMYTPEPRTNICWMTFGIVFLDPFGTIYTCSVFFFFFFFFFFFLVFSFL